MRILVVEDDSRVADLVGRTVREGGWAADLVANGTGALAAMSKSEYDLAVVDIGLPDLTGLELCRRWRAAGNQTPILMLTARNALSDRVTGLDAGADDYLAKPFAAEELLARLRALARRPPSALTPVLHYDDLEVDPAAHSASRGGRRIRLTTREFAFLEFAMRHPGRLLTRSLILNHVWDDNFEPVANAVDVLVGRVRRKLEAGGARPLIHTIRGSGYVLGEREPEKT
jgi:DNA-binding response OmpR family regulator